MRKLFVTGASGFLAWNICQAAKRAWEIFGTVFSHPTKELKALFDVGLEIMQQFNSPQRRKGRKEKEIGKLRG